MYGDVPKMAEGTPLERVQVVNSGARVQIPPSALISVRYQKNEPWKLKIEQYTNPEDSKHKAGFGLGFEKNSEQNQSNEGLKRLAKLIV